MDLSKENVWTADSKIVEEELPVSAYLKVTRRNDPDWGLTDDEIQERNEFIQWYLLQDFVPLMLIPKQAAENDFFIPDCDVTSNEYSAFNTHDFQENQRPFDKYGYAMKKIMERIKDLAIMHSVINSREGRLTTFQRYENLVEFEFRNRLLDLVDRCKRTNNPAIKSAIKRNIGELNRRILEAKKIWEQHAPWDG
jgi:hypothetical protein